MAILTPPSKLAHGQQEEVLSSRSHINPSRVIIENTTNARSITTATFTAFTAFTTFATFTISLVYIFVAPRQRATNMCRPVLTECATTNCSPAEPACQTCTDLPAANN